MSNSGPKLKNELEIFKKSSIKGGKMYIKITPTVRMVKTNISFEETTLPSSLAFLVASRWGPGSFPDFHLYLQPSIFLKIIHQLIQVNFLLNLQMHFR